MSFAQNIPRIPQGPGYGIIRIVMPTSELPIYSLRCLQEHHLNAKCLSALYRSACHTGHGHLLG